MYFILFIFLSNTYLIFDCACLTLALADKHRIAKYARAYIRRFTHTHIQKSRESRKPGKTKKRRGGQGRKKEKRKGQKGKRGEEKRRGKREKGGRGGGKKRKTEGDGFRGIEERGYEEGRTLY